ncbi:MAG TPA: tetratricopeptide repeat protein [Rudaea sp.]|nr:tetratricopeptide repeat protein [Rudaea sp.]
MKRSLFAELRRRNVFKAAAAYLALGWVVTQVTSTVAPLLHLPEWIGTVVVWIGVIGFPFVIMFSWIYEMTPEGLKRESEVDRSASITHITNRRLDYFIVGLLILAIGLFAFDRFVPRRVEAPAASREAQTSAVPSASTPSAASAVPAASDNSIAVLPFVNMSSDKEQEYFSDGISEELLNLLAKIPQLQVTARTSSFSFKGKEVAIPEIARTLHVAHVLEGSVRKSGNSVRITAQLIKAGTDTHLWSQTYDRKLDDIFAIQDEIAADVVKQLKVALLGDVAAKIEAGGTRNPAAFDAYLRAAGAYRRFGPVNLAAGGLNKDGLQTAIDAYTQAIGVDSDYAIAYAGRSLAFADFARALVSGPEAGDYLNKAQIDARKAISLAPELADGHLALANFFVGSLEITGAFKEYERALALTPGDARVLREYGAFVLLIGRTEAGLAAARRLLILDPLNPTNHFGLGVTLVFAKRYADAVRAFSDAKALGQDDVSVNMWLGITYYQSGDFENARATCARAGEVNGPWCLAMVYDKLGRRAEAEAMLAKLRDLAGDQFAEGYADIYAQWGDTARALDWLETALRNRDPYLAYTKVNFFFDPLRKEPRYQAIERALKFPD